MCPWTVRRTTLASLALLAALLAAPARAADGDQDPTFAAAGVLGAEPFYVMRAAARLPDQDVAIVGTLDYLVDPYLDWLRIASDGHVIQECGHSIPFLASFTGRAVLADRNGNLVVGGSATITGSESQERAILARFDAADVCDTLDLDWSANGWQLLDSESFCDTEDCTVVGLAEAPTAFPRLFALLQVRVSTSSSRYFVIAFQSSGSVNPLFGTNGYAEVAATDLGAMSSRGARLAVDPQGRPLVLGTRLDPVTSGDLDPVIMRFTTAGAADETFHAGGYVVLDANSTADAVGSALAVAPDGTIYAAANSLETDNTGMVYCQRAGGSGWSGAGHGDSPIAAIALQGDGKLLTVINSTVGDVVVVYRQIPSAANCNGASDPSFGSLSGHEFYDVDLGGADGQRVGSIVLSEGRPILLGNADTNATDGLFAIRLRNRFLFADGFEVGSRALWSAAH